MNGLSGIASPKRMVFLASLRILDAANSHSPNQLGIVPTVTDPAYRKWWTRWDFFGVPFAILVATSNFSYRYWIEPPLAMRSLRAGGPLDPETGVSIGLAQPRYREELWEALEGADWSSPEKNRELWSAHEFAMVFLDPRTPVELQRFARLINAHPLILTEPPIASILASQRQYVCIPAMLRFTLFDRDSECTSALEHLGAPQAAWPILLNYVASENEVTTRYRGGKAVPLDSQTRSRIRLLLGTDPGADSALATAVLEEKARGHHAPIPDDVADEADQIVALCRAYMDAIGFPREWDHGVTIPEDVKPILAAPDFSSFKREVEERIEAAKRTSFP